MSTEVTTLTLALILISGAMVPTPARSQDVCQEAQGVWELQSDNREGTFITSERITVVLFSDTDRAPFQGTPGTEAERARAFSEIYAEVFEWECNDGRLDVLVTHSYHPNRVGLRLKEEIEVEGDVITWWVLQADGTRRTIPNGVARRIQR
jgi:hypothetical protein